MHVVEKHNHVLRMLFMIHACRLLIVALIVFALVACANLALVPKTPVHMPKQHSLQSACAAWKSSASRHTRVLGIAGLFNTGTNLLYQLLQQNCKFPRDSQIHWQVPWGKHNPVSFRGRLVANTEEAASVKQHKEVLPILIVKDPLRWVASMCRHSYTAHWNAMYQCPNLVYNKRPETPLEVIVRFGHNHTVEYKSLVHMWNTWYSQWLDSEFPFWIVRFEDLLFQSQAVVTRICECVHGLTTKPFQHIHKRASPSKHGETPSGLNDTLKLYSNQTARTSGFSVQDLEYFDKSIDKTLLDKFGYNKSLFF